MKITNIIESGTNNILKWAISNNADIKEDRALISVINDELSYIVTLEDVNFFELFRLTQMYRDKLNIIDERKAEMPSSDELHKLFNGIYKVDPNDPSKDVQLYEIVEHCGNQFINLSMQMINDDHIITADAVRMFLPMISRKFTIQIPIEFKDLIDSMSVDEAYEIYNSNYPDTINSVIGNEAHGAIITLQLALLRSTLIIKYDKQYEKYIKILKYSPLKTCNNNKLYKLALLGFFKYDSNSKREVRIDLFNSNKEYIRESMTKMENINSPLQSEFVIQLPIQYMQVLENSFGQDILPIAYESSMSNIIDSGLKYENFITLDIDDDLQVQEHNNAIESYRMRIGETNQTMLNSLPILLNSEGDVDTTSVFSILPSIYTTKAVIRVDIDNIEKLISIEDPIISDMFNDIIDIMSGINSDIIKSR